MHFPNKMTGKLANNDEWKNFFVSFHHGINLMPFRACPSPQFSCMHLNFSAVLRNRQKKMCDGKFRYSIENMWLFRSVHCMHKPVSVWCITSICAASNISNMFNTYYVIVRKCEYNCVCACRWQWPHSSVPNQSRLYTPLFTYSSPIQRGCSLKIRTPLLCPFPLSPRREKTHRHLAVRIFHSAKFIKVSNGV